MAARLWKRAWRRRLPKIRTRRTFRGHCRLCEQRIFVEPSTHQNGAPEKRVPSTGHLLRRAQGRHQYGWRRHLPRRHSHQQKRGANQTTKPEVQARPSQRVRGARRTARQGLAKRIRRIMQTIRRLMQFLDAASALVAPLRKSAKQYPATQAVNLQEGILDVQEPNIPFPEIPQRNGPEVRGSRSYTA